MKHRTVVRKTALWLSVVLALTLFLSACSGNDGDNMSSESESPGKTESSNNNSSSKTDKESEPAKESEPREVIEITMLPGTIVGGASGIQTDPVAKVIEQELGIKINVIDPSGAEGAPDRWNVMLTSGDIPDLSLVASSFAKQLIEGDLILPLEDLVAAHGPDVTGTIPNLLEFSKQNYSNGTGKLYMIPVQDGSSTPPYSYDNVAPMVRWDYYKELGFPKINSEDDLLNMLKQMQDRHPQNENGQKVYAISGFTDLLPLWWATTLPYFEFYGLTTTGGQIAIDPDNNSHGSTLHVENGIFFKAAEFWAKAYRIGLMDPDTFTQKMDQYMEKVKQNRLLFNIASWLGSGTANAAFVEAGTPEKGWQALPPFEGGYRLYGFDSKLGNAGRNFVISKDAKHPERIMELINWFMSYEGSMTTMIGPKGSSWVIENGIPQLTDEHINLLLNDVEFIKKTGAGLWENTAGHLGGLIHPKYNVPLNLHGTKQVFSKRVTNRLDKVYSEHYNATYPGEVVENLVKEGKAELSKHNVTALAALAATNTPDEVVRIDQAVIDLLQKSLPKLVMTKDKADFDKIKAEIVQELDKLGYYSKSLPYWEGVYNEAKAKYDQLVK